MNPPFSPTGKLGAKEMMRNGGPQFGAWLTLSEKLGGLTIAIKRTQSELIYALYA